MSLIHNLRLRGLKDILSWRKIKIYLRYQYYRIKGTKYPELLIPEYREQIALRMSNPGCSECIKAGECVHCGCPSPELFYDKDNSDSGENWGPMHDPETWRKLNVPVDRFYLDQVEKKGKVTKFKWDS